MAIFFFIPALRYSVYFLTKLSPHPHEITPPLVRSIVVSPPLPSPPKSTCILVNVSCSSVLLRRTDLQFMICFDIPYSRHSFK
jgi:hypothetical protein